MISIFKKHSGGWYGATNDLYYKRAKSHDDTLKFMKFQFPRHFSRCKKIIHSSEHLPLGCGRITILDIGSGPLTFTQAVLDELLLRSDNYSGGSYKISILAVDISDFNLSMGQNMMNEWELIFKKKGWHLDFNLIKTDLNFIIDLDAIKNWIKLNKYEYFIMGVSSARSSGIQSVINIVEDLIKDIKDRTSSIFIIEPNKKLMGKPKLKFLEFFSKYDFFRVQVIIDKINNILVREKKSLKIFSIVSSSYNAIPHDYFNIEIFNNYLDNFAYYYHKTKNWIANNLDDKMIFFLYEFDLNHSLTLLRRSLINIKKQYYQNFPTRKKLSFRKSRRSEIIPLDYCLYSIILLDGLGKKLDANLEDCIYGGRVKKKYSISWIYEYYPPYFSKFLSCGKELDCQDMNYIKFKCDFHNYFPMINRDKLKSIFNKYLLKEKISYDNFPSVTFNIIDDLLGEPVDEDGICGIPITSPLSRLLSNLYLLEFDKKLINSDIVADYARFIDDFIIIGTLKEMNVDSILSELEITPILEDLSVSLNLDKITIDLFDSSTEIFEEYQNSIELNNLQSTFMEIIYPLYYLAYSLNPLLTSEEELINFLKAQDYNKFSEFFLHLGIRIEPEMLFKRNSFTVLKYKDHLLYDKIPYKSKIYDILKFPADYKQLNSTQIPQKIKELNPLWFENYNNYNKLLFQELKEELLKWKDFFQELDKFQKDFINQIFDNKLKEDLLLKKEDTDFKLSFRKIQFILNKLTIIISKDLKNNVDGLFEEVSKLDIFGFPLKVLGRFFLAYGRVDLIIKKIKESWEQTPDPFRGSEDFPYPKIFKNEAAYLIRLLTLYFDRHTDELESIFPFLEKLIQMSSDEIKIAITEFLFDLNLIDRWKIDFWIDHISKSNNLYLLKNLILCLAIHSDSGETIHPIVKEKILENGIYSFDENIINLCLNLWSKLKNIDFTKIKGTFSMEFGKTDGCFELEDELRSNIERMDDNDYLKIRDLDLADEFISDYEFDFS